MCSDCFHQCVDWGRTLGLKLELYESKNIFVTCIDETIPQDNNFFNK